MNSSTVLSHPKKKMPSQTKFGSRKMSFSTRSNVSYIVWFEMP